MFKLEICVICQGDTKGAAKGDGSVKKDTVGGQPGPNAQVELDTILFVTF